MRETTKSGIDTEENRKHLLGHGWQYDGRAHVHQWRDPVSRLSWYTLRDAMSMQIQREKLTNSEE